MGTHILSPVERTITGRERAEATFGGRGGSRALAEVVSRTLGAILTTGLLSVALAAQTPQTAAPALDLQQPIPFDAAVRTGTLTNGVRFFVRQNPRPEKRVSLRLAVKAGSLFEADDQ